MRKSFKFKLYQNKRKNKKLDRLINTASEIWNYCIEQQKLAYKNGEPYIHKYELQSQIKDIRNYTRNWGQLGSQVVQDVTDRVDKAYQRFFQWAKTRKGPRMLPPKFKSNKKYKSITYKQAGWKYDGSNEIVIQKVKYKFHKSREILGDIKTVTIKRDSLGDFWVIFSCDDVFEDYTTNITGGAVGVDFGLKTFLTLSDMTEIVSPQFFKQNLNKLRKVDRELSSKKRGSNNREKARLNKARLYRKVSNQRSDFHWKLARYLVSNYDVICLEDLNIEGMKRLWGRKVSDLGFSDFVLKLQHFANKEGKTIHFIDRFYPSSKTCFECGFVNKELELKDREWCCPECGVIHDRDLNASWNILAESGRALSDRLVNVRPLFGGNSWLTLESHML